MTKINRTEFLRAALGLAGVGIGAAGLAACSNDNGYGGGPAAGSGGTTGGGLTNACDTHPPTDTIGSNHGHVLTVTSADAAAGVDKTYDIMGAATHTHSVTITAAMFAMLETGATVTTSSTVNSGHDHAITVVCA
jgi:hypothetical protein